MLCNQAASRPDLPILKSRERITQVLIIINCNLAAFICAALQSLLPNFVGHHAEG